MQVGKIESNLRRYNEVYKIKYYFSILGLKNMFCCCLKKSFIIVWTTVKFGNVWDNVWKQS